LADPAFMLLSLGLGFFVAFTIGANDETMTPAVGAGLLSLGLAVFVGGIFNFIGVFFLGESVSKTVGNKFTTADFTLSLSMVFVILLSMGIWLFIVSMKGVPISSTQSVVGSVLGVLLIHPDFGLAAVNFETLFLVVSSWFISPIFGFSVTFLIGLFGYIVIFLLQLIIKKI